MRLIIRDLAEPILRPLKFAAEAILPRIQETDAEVCHQPLVARVRREIDAGGDNVDRTTTDALNPIDVDQRPVRVREVGDRLEVVSESVRPGHERDCDEVVFRSTMRSISSMWMALSRAGTTRTSSPRCSRLWYMYCEPSKCSASVTTLPPECGMPSPATTRFSPTVVLGTNAMSDG